jgi:hypothetical protein
MVALGLLLWPSHLCIRSFCDYYIDESFVFGTHARITGRRRVTGSGGRMDAMPTTEER